MLEDGANLQRASKDYGGTDLAVRFHNGEAKPE
jgi:hypothetical protein